MDDVAAQEAMPKRATARPRVSFDSKNIWRRLEACQTVARAYGWHPNDIIAFTQEIHTAFSWEDAMAIIDRHFDVVRSPGR